MKHSVPHDLDMDLARRATDCALRGYKERFADFDPKIDWVNDDCADISFKAKGISLKGKVQLTRSQVGLELNVPFAFRLFQRKAVDIIEREIRKWLEKARKGELPEPDAEAAT